MNRNNTDFDVYLFAAFVLESQAVFTLEAIGDRHDVFGFSIIDNITVLFGSDNELFVVSDKVTVVFVVVKASVHRPDIVFGKVSADIFKAIKIFLDFADKVFILG